MNRRRAILSIILLASAVVYFIFVRNRSKRKFDVAAELRNYESLVIALSETIIPETEDSPGAKQASVYIYIFNSIKDCTRPREQRTFLDGLRRTQEHSFQKFGIPFEVCSPYQKSMILSNFERAASIFDGFAGKVKDKVFGASFFDIVKRLTVEGYCSSMVGATEGLRYDSLPGRYLSCIDITPGERAWATT